VTVATWEAAEGLALRSAQGRIALVATVAASAMASLDATVVTVALPHIGSDLHASVSALQWVLTGYLASLASLILLGGALGDRLGRRRVFVAGTVWFAAASALCGAAPNIGVLVAGRVLQGVGGALLTPGSLAILEASFRESDRASAVGAWSGLGAVAGAIGPFVGGALVDGPGWRWAFLLNLPVAALAVGCAHAAVPETRDRQAPTRLHYAGVALAVVGLAAGTWAPTGAGSGGWTNPSVIAAGGAALAAIAAFVWHLAHTAAPLVPPRLFRNRAFTVVNLMTVVLYGAIGVSFFVVAYQLEVAAGWSALRAGSALLPTTVLMLALSARSGALAERIGPRLQLGVGPLVAGVGLLLLSRIAPMPRWQAMSCPVQSCSVWPRDVRRTAHRDGPCRRRHRPRERRLGSEQRGGADGQPLRACRHSRHLRALQGDRTDASHPRVPTLTPRGRVPCGDGQPAGVRGPCPQGEGSAHRAARALCGRRASAPT
jgi:EmrB/QacA subfamily drug resistance transporter